MANDSTQRVEDIFHAALELEAHERGSFVARECAGDGELAEEVSSLLAAHSDAPEFSPRASPPHDRNIGRIVGRYRLLAEIAHGGMGTVYRAERADGEYQQHVAVKLIALDITFGARAQREELTLRFHAERQYLARLDHPNIAKLLDGGTTDEGAPYLVMELIDGAPIDRYCAEHDLPLRARLELFRDVCKAVQFIHTKLVAHRDLKPSNILVQRGSTAGDAPTPKLLDFGIAKLLRSDESIDSLATTNADMRRMTPAYASPEQFKNEPVTTASDVYSLGVILYELLTDRLPYDLERATPLDAARAVCETPPLNPSELRRELRGELETIVLKALEKEPARRYQSAAALESDIELYLGGYPISARPASAAYRFAKTVARHKLPSALAAVLFISISALSVWLGVLYRRSVHAETLAASRLVDTQAALKQAEIARGDAQNEARRAEQHSREAMNNALLLQKLFASPDPYERLGADVTVREVLDDASERLKTELDDQPLIKAALQGTLGWTYLLLGDIERAEPLLRAAYAMHLLLVGAGDPETLKSQINVAMLLHRQGKPREAVEMQAAALTEASRALGVDHEVTITSRGNLAMLLHVAGRFAEAQEQFVECMAARRRTGVAENEDALVVLQNYAHLLLDLLRPDEAEKITREVLRVRLANFADDEYSIAESRLALGKILTETGKLDESAECYRAAIADLERIVGPEHGATLSTKNGYGSVLAGQGRLTEAEELLRSTLEASKRTRGVNHLETLICATNLALVYMAQHRFDEALALHRDIAERFASSIGTAHPYYIAALTNLANALDATGEHAEAAKLRAQADELREQAGRSTRQ